MRLLLPILLLLVSLPAAAAQPHKADYGQDYPWLAGPFFHDCADLPKAHLGEDGNEAIEDAICARYIEGLSEGVGGQEGIRRGCIANPIALFIVAREIYKRNDNPGGATVDYVREAMIVACPEK